MPTLEFLGVIKTRDIVVGKKKEVDAPYKREAVLVLLLLLLPRKIHENNEGNVIGEKNNELNSARQRRSAAETSVVTAMTL